MDKKQQKLAGNNQKGVKMVKKAAKKGEES